MFLLGVPIQANLAVIQKNFIAINCNSINFNFLNQLNYIFNRTKIAGSALSSEKLIEKVDKIINLNESYELIDFFRELSCNCLID